MDHTTFESKRKSIKIPSGWVNFVENREWIPSEYPGIERSLLRNNETGGRSSVVRLVK
jgi:hypothetical protein